MRGQGLRQWRDCRWDQEARESWGLWKPAKANNRPRPILQSSPADTLRRSSETHFGFLIPELQEKELGVICYNSNQELIQAKKCNFFQKKYRTQVSGVILYPGVRMRKGYDNVAQEINGKATVLRGKLWAEAQDPPCGHGSCGRGGSGSQAGRDCVLRASKSIWAGRRRPPWDLCFGTLTSSWAQLPKDERWRKEMSCGN